MRRKLPEGENELPNYRERMKERIASMAQASATRARLREGVKEKLPDPAAVRAYQRKMWADCHHLPGKIGHNE